MNLEKNVTTLDQEYQWFSEFIRARFAAYFNKAESLEGVFSNAPDLSENDSPYAIFINELPIKIRLQAGEESISDEEVILQQIQIRLLLLLALAPHLKPQLLDLFFTKNKLFDRGYTEFGGILGQQHSGFLPTGETALFLIGGDNLLVRFELAKLFTDSHFLFQESVIQLIASRAIEPFMSGTLTISAEYLTKFTTGTFYEPIYSTNFPAKRITTKLEWDQLILDPYVLSEIEEIYAWIKHQDKILIEWGLGNRIKQGYRTLFYGPPGTGKTLAATLVGKRAKNPVFRIDLSQVVSKYIGETEKNLANIFNQAEHKKWVLFFDEADALFGKRSNTSDAKDRYANQEIAYLLQRIEDFSGVVILATNLKGNIDEAFARRFQSMIYFAIPNAEQRLELWERTFGKNLPLSEDIDFAKIARDYEISGGGIINVLRYCTLTALRRKGEPLIQMQDIIFGIRKEFRKEGKTL